MILIQIAFYCTSTPLIAIIPFTDTTRKSGPVAISHKWRTFRRKRVSGYPFQYTKITCYVNFSKCSSSVMCIFRSKMFTSYIDIRQKIYTTRQNLSKSIAKSNDQIYYKQSEPRTFPSYRCNFILLQFEFNFYIIEYSLYKYDVQL